ncbi:protein POF1B isoform X1 [Eublepharis macularius]|uniref:Protein POF1B isoform X1 n=2 Tax=Eublepharis macularius TaxID=481883 RepID=A0AA97LDN1_EUBMA|nr:protein POF1B isoform X1 [Eublepharis macularius]
MFGAQQQVQQTPLPPPLPQQPQQKFPRPPPPMPCYPPPPQMPSYPPPPPSCRPCFEPPGPPPPQYSPYPPPQSCAPPQQPCQPAPLLPRPSPAPVLPRTRQSRPAPLPMPFPEQQHQHQEPGGGGSVVYERVRTYSSPGGKRVQLLEPPNCCSPRAPSPAETTPGYQHVIWSTEPPLQESSSPSLKLSPYSQGTVRRIILENPEQEPLSPLLRGGNNVIIEKTVRKYELLNPEQEKQYHYALQHTQADPCQVSQPVERVVQQCQHTQTGGPCDITPIYVNDGGNHTVRKVTVQTCEPVMCVPEANDQLDSRYFGELLAELNRKSNDLHSCLLQHVEKLGGRRYEIDSFSQTEDIESLIPKGLSESTKQQIRYLLQMRVTADKSMRLVLATFSNLREELLHLQDDLGKLETDKALLEKDLSFKECQVREYETLLASVRENNRQQQKALRESTLKCRSLEEQLISLRHNDGDKEFRLKDLEYSKQALEQEVQSLRLQVSSNPLIQTTTDELSSRYVEMINQLRDDKDRQIRSLRSQLCDFQKDISKKEGTDADLQMRLHELNLRLEEKESWIKQQEEEIFRLKQEKLAGSPSQGITKTIITKKYRNQYPILGLLSDDYKVTSPVKESQTIVIEKTGEMWKQESFTSD